MVGVENPHIWWPAVKFREKSVVAEKSRLFPFDLILQCSDFTVYYFHLCQVSFLVLTSTGKFYSNHHYKLIA